MDFRLFIALACSSCLAALGQLLLKIGATSWGLLVFINSHVIIGIVCYTASLGLWLYGLSRAPLYVVYPFAILTFVLVGLLGIVVLGERPNLGVMAGWGIISIGIALVFLSSVIS
jgi:drug/metabolite transporter (DMT)-like permease